VAQLPSVSDAELADSIDDISLGVDDITTVVDDVESTATDAGETVVTLRSDVLFAFGEAQLPPSAGRRIAALVAKAPRGARLKVYGHTDSVGSDASNRTLSLARAKAGAAAVRKARPDLRLDVKGFGESRPVQPNEQGGDDNPDGRAANRRVELRYAG
jgi:outer membrane protein OmpA-like peptidoglycan-associated protein